MTAQTRRNSLAAGNNLGSPTGQRRTSTAALTVNAATVVAHAAHTPTARRTSTATAGGRRGSAVNSPAAAAAAAAAGAGRRTSNVSSAAAANAAAAAARPRRMSTAAQTLEHSEYHIQTTQEKESKPVNTAISEAFLAPSAVLSMQSAIAHVPTVKPTTASQRPRLGCCETTRRFCCGITGSAYIDFAPGSQAALVVEALQCTAAAANPSVAVHAQCSLRVLQ